MSVFVFLFIAGELNLGSVGIFNLESVHRVGDNFLLCSAKENVLSLVSPKLEVLNTYEARGGGPKDLKSPKAFVLDGQVFSLSRHTLNLFDSSLVPLEAKFLSPDLRKNIRAVGTRYGTVLLFFGPFSEFLLKEVEFNRGQLVESDAFFKNPSRKELKSGLNLKKMAFHSGTYHEPFLFRFVMGTEQSPYKIKVFNQDFRNNDSVPLVVLEAPFFEETLHSLFKSCGAFDRGFVVQLKVEVENPGEVYSRRYFFDTKGKLLKHEKVYDRYIVPVSNAPGEFFEIDYSQEDPVLRQWAASL